MRRGSKAAIPSILEGLNLWRLLKLKCQNTCLKSSGLANGMPKTWSNYSSKKCVALWRMANKLNCLALAISICVTKTNVRDVTRNRRRYSDHGAPCGDFPSGAEVEK